MKAYLEPWDKRIAGATGTKENVKAAAKAYRVYYSKGPVDQTGDYNMDHTVVMYLVGPKGEFVKHYNSSMTAPQIAKDILTRFQTYQGL
jgi:protein SCO1/2